MPTNPCLTKSKLDPAEKKQPPTTALSRPHRRVVGAPGLVVEVAGVARGTVVPRTQPHLLPTAACVCVYACVCVCVCVCVRARTKATSKESPHIHLTPNPSPPPLHSPPAHTPLTPPRERVAGVGLEARVRVRVRG